MRIAMCMERVVEDASVAASAVARPRQVGGDALVFESPGRPPRLTEALARALARVIVKARPQAADTEVAATEVPDALAS